MKTELIQRIKNQFPNVHITFLSVLVGFAIEDLVSIARSEEVLYEGTLLTAIHWVLVASCLFAIIVAWLAYTLTSIARRAVPSPVDTFNILILAVTLFLLNSTIGQPLWYWYASIAFYLIVGGSATWFSVSQMEKEDPIYLDFAKQVKHWKGPLIINMTSFPVIIIFGLGAWYGFIPLWAHLIYLIIGAAGFVLWIVQIYRMWHKFLFDS